MRLTNRISTLLLAVRPKDIPFAISLSLSLSVVLILNHLENPFKFLATIKNWFNKKKSFLIPEKFLQDKSPSSFTFTLVVHRWSMSWKYCYLEGKKIARIVSVDFFFFFIFSTLFFFSQKFVILRVKNFFFWKLCEVNENWKGKI